jgi:hypothetical protein
MPSGDSPQVAERYYQYLQSRQLEPHGRTQTWHVDWAALAWMWGFAIVVAVILLLWIRQYRSTRQQGGLFPVDTWAGYTTEGAGPATTFVVFFTLVVVASGAVLVVGHLIDGQVF